MGPRAQRNAPHSVRRERLASSGGHPCSGRHHSQSRTVFALALCWTGSTVLAMREVDYESCGLPLADYQLTRSDHRQQEQSEDIERWVKKVLAEKEAEEQADPVLEEGRRKAAERALEMLLGHKNPESDIMRWRVRLYCGHIVETRRHRENGNPTLHGSSSMRCPECGKKPSVIVAFEPIGLAGEPPGASKAVPALAPKRLTRAQLERRVSALEKENQRLRDSGTE